MKDKEIAALRLRNQQLVAQTARTPAEVVARMCAMQAQDYAGTLWSVAMRMANDATATEATVEQALTDGSIVRSWPLRRTYHIVAAADLRWMLALLAPRTIAGATTRRHGLGIDDATLDKAMGVVMDRVGDGAPHTRGDLVATMEAAGITTEGQRGIHMLVHMAQAALICMGPRVGKEYTFVALDKWLPPTPELAKDEALGRLAARYFTGHGPATLQDLVRWAHITMGDARKGVQVAGKALVEVMAGDTKYLMGAEAADNAAPEPPAALLLPGFDEILLGYADKSAMIGPAYEALWCPGGNGMFKPFIMAEGRVVGLWSRKLKKKSVAVTVQPFEALSAELEAAIAAQAERYGRFLELDAELT